MKNKKTTVLYLETPTNPTLKILDIAKLSAAAKAANPDCIVIVDNTFASPVNQNPLKLGADLVIHSGTKFLCGHGDAMGGFLTGKKSLVQQVYHYREVTGAALDPMSAFLIIRGLKTLDLRVKQHNSNALAVAKRLMEPDLYPKYVKSVFYPGLETHKYHEIAKKQMHSGGFGGVLSFELNCDDFEMVKKFLGHLKIAYLAASLGHVETLVGPPSVTSHVECTAEERARLGISESLVRYSTGIENAEDLIRDIEQAIFKTFGVN